MTQIPFTPSPGLKFLMETFIESGYDIRVVGGAVRDMILGEEPKDIDLCTTATPDQMIELAERFGITCIPTGLQHGTVTFVMKYSETDHNSIVGAVDVFEVTTLRIDMTTDGRHADVIFTTDFEEDARRRDLTFNAMSMDITGKVYDYFGGMADLSNRTIKFVGRSEDRIQEDYLRILRAFRFAARFDAMVADENQDSIEKHAKGLQQISKERVWDEMSKLLVAKSYWYAMVKMQRLGIFPHIGLPDWKSPDVWKPLDLMARADCAITALSLLFDETNINDFIGSWKFSTDEALKLAWLVKHRPQTPYLFDIEDMLVVAEATGAKVRREWIVSWCKLHGDNRLTYHAETWQPPVFPVRGADLLESGLKPGREIGQKIDHMKRTWVASRFQMTKEELLNAVH